MIGRACFGSSLGGWCEPCHMSANWWAGVKRRHTGAPLPRATLPLVFNMHFHSVTQFSRQYVPACTHCTWQLPSPLLRVPLQQKGRCGTLRQRNASAGYQENFFFHTELSGGLLHGQESSAKQLLQHGKSVSVCRERDEKG